jgi:ketosteroid isomerase-like protein
MKKHLSMLAALSFMVSGAFAQSANDKIAVARTLDGWHQAAAEGKFDAYFALMTKEAIFIGTDPTENWTKDEFQAFAKHVFDKGPAWDFKPVERNIFFSKDGNTAYFDELLDTWMKLCRGSGVLTKEDGKWKIAHYVLSVQIPNDNINEVIKLKKDFDDKFVVGLKEKK